jgi:septal ring factor EnvC (AmiA/AmiB activator)
MPKKRYILGWLLAVVVLVGLFLRLDINSHQPVGAESAASLQSQISQLQSEINANQQVVNDLKKEADSLRAKIAEFDAEIAQTQKQIDLTNLKIKQLNLEIEEAETELAYQKGILAESIRELYKRGDITTVELLASSDSYTDFINEQEYLSRLKSGIQESAAKIEELKEQLEENRAKQMDLAEELEGQRRILDNQRAEQQSLLDITEGQEAKYQSIVNRLKKQQREAENALIAALGSGSYKTAPIGPVSTGEIIGNVGNSGLSSGPHLHLEYRIGGARHNPGPYIQHPAVSPVMVTQGYGNPDPIYIGGYHPGIDYAPGSGAVFAIKAGYLYRGCSNDMLGTSGNDYGYVAVVDHGGGHTSIYAHLAGGPSACNYNTYPW